MHRNSYPTEDENYKDAAYHAITAILWNSASPALRQTHLVQFINSITPVYALSPPAR
jgi:hypothetical protein